MISVVALLALGGFAAVAAEPEGDLVIEMSGKPAAEQGFAMSLRFGDAVTQAVRVYSEPSHTLLAAIADEEFVRSEDGQAWQGKYEASAMAMVVTSLPESQPSLLIPAPPEDDKRIAVWVRGDLMSDGSDETLVADAAITGGEFSFSTYLSADAGLSN